MRQFKMDLPPTLNSSQFVGKGRFYKSREYSDYVQFAGLAVPVKIRGSIIAKPTKLRLDLAFHIWRDADIDSRLKPVLDALEGNLYENDMQITELMVIKVKVPKTEVCVWVKPIFISEEVQRDLPLVEPASEPF